MTYQKRHYRDLCATETSIPIFSRDWWLDVVCGEDNWNVAVVNRGGKIIGALPWFARKRYGFTLLTQPPLTQTLGPWIRSSSAKYAKVLGYQKDVMEALIDQLPPFSYFKQQWHYNLGNWLPFYWRGFQQTTRYTYVLTDLIDEKSLWSELQENIRTEIRKASNRVGIKARDDLGLEYFFPLNRMTFNRQRREIPYSYSLIERLDAACSVRNCRKIWIAEDDQGRHHAGVYIVWDENSAYYLMGGGDPELRNSGATSLCVWEAIRHAATVTQRFDFEGSMLEPVERFFRAFGARQMPYFSVSKTPSRLIRAAMYAKTILRE